MLIYKHKLRYFACFCLVLSAFATLCRGLTILKLVEYKQWANELTFAALDQLPVGEAEKQRATRFGNMLHTLNHVYVIDDVFKAHLRGQSHAYTSRNTETHPPLETLWRQQQEMDLWYSDYA